MQSLPTSVPRMCYKKVNRQTDKQNYSKHFINDKNNDSGVLPIRNMLALFRIKHVANIKENINEKAVRPIQALI